MDGLSVCLPNQQTSRMGAGDLPVLFPVVTPEPGTYYVGKKVEDEYRGAGATNSRLPDAQCRTQISPLSSGWIQAYFKSHIDSSSRGPRAHINSKGKEKLGERGKAVIMNQSLCYFSHTPNKHSKFFKTGVHNGPVLPSTGLEVGDVSLSLTESRTPNGPN